ncbi:MAG: preprotein translocase subunit SecG [Candidatus Nephrothrix sp. EaCA]|nr:MAG: preprotein translocase subunit SecG [Candidatus Nephrothrix sp. EaCA]
MLYILLISVAIFCAILLVLVVLAQNSKGGGLSSQFGGSGASNLIGVKKTGDVLERLTWGFAIAVMALTLASTKITPSQSSPSNELMNKAKEEKTEQPVDFQKPADSLKK